MEKIEILQKLINKYLPESEYRPFVTNVAGGGFQIDYFFIMPSEVERKSIKGVVKIPAYKLEVLREVNNGPDYDPDVESVELFESANFDEICVNLISEYIKDRVRDTLLSDGLCESFQG